ncbi:S8 family peptidase [Maricaulis parjimensis]|uniref:S8 family peptidase n=1 Tax=Maricaulis parjimensis TaxID=144023 RepID=UPI00193AA9C5|nr:S8 family peptidase [Maricaulis parjimensis]
MTKKQNLRQTSAALALTAALLPVTGLSAAQAQESEDTDNSSGVFILPFHGDINPFFHGDIDPFHGDISPFHGDINPFHGDINPFYGDISPFWGDINPFWGDINPFHGDISPFHGDINPFWGDIEAFHGDIEAFHGDINPFWGDIAPFWGDIGPFWGDISAFWGDIDAFSESSAGDYGSLADQLNSMFAQAEAVFGSAIEAQTGSSFRDAFLADLLAKYGFDPSDPESLDGVSAEDRSRFFLDFYDGLMGYTGIDHVDHWMPAINWSPALSQSVGGGDGTVVGLLDFSFDASELLTVRTQRGDTSWMNFNHGAAVASLIAAPMDGQGVMGLAPESTLISYNPFDETLTSNWNDVREGVLALVHQNASVINMSLGVPGWTFHQDWADILSDRSIRRQAGDTLFVFAAGNDGVTQTRNVDWSSVWNASNLLIVGSVDPNGRISRFSNTPGTACLTIYGQCYRGNRLMDRFLVAPGELILVSDGEGGVTRLSGTSFAAPLVTGAAALVQGRWEWLKAHNVADVLLRSATDLGAEGVDEVYGWGLLNVDAALRPLDGSNLYVVDSRGRLRNINRLGVSAGRLQVHAQDATITLYEPLGWTYRDFQVSYNELMASSDLSESQKAAITEIYLAERARSGEAGFADTVETGRLVDRSGNLTVTAFASAADPYQRLSNQDLPFQAGLEIADTASGRSLRLGMGEGALALNRQSGFQLFSDHRPETGGVNPVLGFASGGAYMLSSWHVAGATRMTVGFSSTDEAHDFVNPFTGEEQAIQGGLPSYQAAAMVADLNHTLSDSLSVNITYTHLEEQTGFLGAQAPGAIGFEGGANTDAVSVGAEADLSGYVQLSASATLARTASTEFSDSVLSLSEDALSTAFQVTALRRGVFAEGDAVRLSVVQPLHLEDGTLTYMAGEISDRSTGAISTQTQEWALGGERAVYTELLYALPLFSERADLSVFGRASLNGNTGPESETSMASGLRFDLRF